MTFSRELLYGFFLCCFKTVQYELIFVDNVQESEVRFLCMIYLISVMYVWVFCQYFLRLRDFLLSYGSKKFNCENLSKRKNYMACITKAHKCDIDYRETWVQIRSSVGSISVSYLFNEQQTLFQWTKN